MDTPEVDIGIRQQCTPVHEDEHSCISEDEPMNNVGGSLTKALLGNSGEENEVHDMVYRKVSPSEPCIDPGNQVGKQYDFKDVKSLTKVSAAKSTSKAKMVDTIQANKKQYGITQTYDSEINATTTSVIQQGQVRFEELLKSISSARAKEDNSRTMKLTRSRVPPKWINLESYKFSMKSRAADLSSVYFEKHHRPQKVISWTEANNSRPSLKIDMDGPGPCTYSPRIKPPTEINAPEYTFGSRYYSRSVKRARTSDMRPRLQFKYTRSNKGTNNRKQLATLSDAPAYTFGHRRDFSFVRREAHMDPSPNEYSRQKADRLILRRGPSFTLQFRQEGTLLWNTTVSALTLRVFLSCCLILLIVINSVDLNPVYVEVGSGLVITGKLDGNKMYRHRYFHEM